MSLATNFKIDGDRLWDALMEMAKIGPGVAGGNNRQTLTDEDAEGRTLFQSWCENAGLTMGLDTMGNMFARREGADPEALPVYVGSHLDTQPTGGKYDGVLGVLGALEIVRSLNDMNVRTRHPIVVVNWTNEEGTRFAPAMLASGVFAGIHEEEWAKARTDAKGKSFGDELKRIGWQGDEPVGARKMKAFFELHIEQGPILEDENIDIGVVTHGQGLYWLEVTLTGKESHTGSTPMPKRRNAGLGLARVTELVHEVAMDYQPDAVGAIGHVDVHPNSRNIIAARWSAPSTSARRPKRSSTRCASASRTASTPSPRRSTSRPRSTRSAISTRSPSTKPASRPSATPRNAFGYSHTDIVSGAGHDACWINRVAPTAMVMCPCVDGLSHNEAEEISRNGRRRGRTC